MKIIIPIADLTEEQIDYFWSKVNVPADKNKCWLWVSYVAGVKGNQYGSIKINGKQLKAHRISYKLYHGKIPDKLFVLHKCNVPICVNPKHLYAGTPQDNSNDMVKSKNQTSGEKNRHAKLTEKEILEIRSKHASLKYSITTLAKDYNIRTGTIGRIINRKRWKHI